MSDTTVIPFHMETLGSAGSMSIIPCGELDLFSSDQLMTCVDEQVALGEDHLVVDLRQIPFMDSSGLKSLLVLDREARHGPHDLTFLHGQAQVERLLDRTGLLTQLPFSEP